MPSSLKTFFATLILTSLSLPVSAQVAKAWGEIGHETVGEIAERNLNARAKALVFDILGPEPLAASGNWPDVVRSDPRFGSFSSYHFVTIPAGGTYATSEHPEKDMYTIVMNAAGKLTDSKVPRNEKMILLRYLAHIIGDIHQPLHVGRPGVMGGNLCTIQFKSPITGKIEQENIHSFWDETVIEYEKAEFKKSSAKAGRKRWFGYFEFADLLLAQSPEKIAAVRAEVNATPLSLAEDVQAWLLESANLGDAAYPKAKLSPEGQRPYCQWQDPKTHKVTDGIFNKKAIPMLKGAYIEQAKKVVRDRILQGGLRLAKILNSLADRSESSALTERDIGVETKSLIQSIHTPKK